MTRALSTFQRLAIATLVAQGALAAWMWTRPDDRAVASAQRLLPALDVAQLARIEIDAPGARPVVLAKRGDGWVIASSYGYPVEPSRIAALTSALGRLSAGAPIAEQAARETQLGVDDASARRTIVATTADGTAQTVRLGVAIDSQHSAARIGSDARVYAVHELSAERVAAEPREWIAPHYVPWTREQIAKVAIERPGADTIELVRDKPATGSGGSGSAGSDGIDAPSWSVLLAGAPIALTAGERLDYVALTKLLASATTMVVAAPGDPTRQITPAATVTITPVTGAPMIIDIVADPEAYWVRTRGASFAARVETARLDPVMHADRAALVTTR